MKKCRGCGKPYDGVQSRCEACKVRYKDWGKLTLEEKLARKSPRVDAKPTGRVTFALRSGNSKTGPIPVSTSERGTCPKSCSFYNAGCYAETGPVSWHWRDVGERGLAWKAFLAAVRDLPEGQLWRHNQAGDLQGDGESINPRKLRELVDANAGRRGFTFTHRRPKTRTELDGLRSANERGFTINLSADSLQQADELAALAVGPVVVVLPEDAPARPRTPEGRPIVVCPAQTNDLTCQDCRLCSKARRKSIIGFLAHGQDARLVSTLVRSKRSHQ